MNERLDLLSIWFDYLLKFPPMGTAVHIREYSKNKKVKFIDQHKFGGIYQDHWTNDEIQDDIFRMEERLLKKL
jgi:hypothetical protein